MKKTVFFYLAIILSSTCWAKVRASSCLFDLEKNGINYTRETAYDARNDEFKKLDWKSQEVLLQALSEVAASQIREIEDLLKFPDNGGADLKMFRIYFPTNSKMHGQRVYQVSMGLGENEFGGFYEVTGSYILGRKNRASIRTLALIQDYDIVYCNSSLKL